MKYERIEKIQEAKIKLFNLFDKALNMAGYDIANDPEMMCSQWAEAMLDLGTGMIQLENLCEKDSLKLLDLMEKYLDNISKTC